MIRRLRQAWRFMWLGLAARHVQDELWGGKPGARRHQTETFESYVSAIEKRVICLRKIDRTNGSWEVETRKRLLQTATVAVALMELIDTGVDV